MLLQRVGRPNAEDDPPQDAASAKPNKDLHLLSNLDLFNFFHSAREEIRRRAEGAEYDPAVIIHGQEYAKRAIVLAAIGQHSLCFIGGPFGKTMLRGLAHALGVETTFEVRPCPCGRLGDPNSACRCTPEQIGKWAKQFPTADMWIEVLRVPEGEMRLPTGTRGQRLETMREQINRALKRERVVAVLDESSSKLFGAMVTDHGLTPRTRRNTLGLAATIARLEGSPDLKMAYVLEALGYRPPRRKDE